MSRISVCIATHERPESLRRILIALERQESRPDEVVISDSSRREDPGLLRDVAASPLAIVRVASERRALPWQRWWAFQHASGERILFLDDDVALREDGIAVLLRLWDALDGKDGEGVAGIGFREVDPEGNPIPRRRDSLRERWLGLTEVPDGRITPGGISVAPGGADGAELAEVDWLWGGAMAYSRAVLARVGCLDLLADLYDQGFGKGEDAVLAVQARRFGRLYVITAPIARHGDPKGMRARAVPQSGWRRGMWGSWGRAHTMRWIAADRKALRRTWLRLAVLEGARSLARLARSPLQQASWTRLAGTLWGSLRALALWNRIPPQPRSPGAQAIPEIGVAASARAGGDEGDRG